MAEEGRSRLGRGLAALIGDMGEADAPSRANAPAPKAGGTRKLPIEQVQPSARNPRRTFVEEGLDELAASIREKGIIQPIVVRPMGTDRFEIVAGERRWRAAQRASLHEVPVVVVELNDREALEIAIIENVQRSDLNALEEAQGYEALMAQFEYTQGDLAKVIGKSRPHIANTIRLLKLPESVKAYLADGRLSAGHARALLAHDDPERLVRAVVEKRLSVRDVEALTKTKKALTEKAGAPLQKDADTKALEKRLGDVLGLAVQLQSKGEAGELRIRYTDLEQLDQLCRRLGVE
ncbi:ParB-like partition protein [Azorhizobium caulinodans ORS 571]|uniref:ParB-like partition protein n=1 Tax=Azorhizobium caulinodans (strain ATCC 43989 / DSM 5975 / JCM 20966 / LMG 6465 / NBRC 14845 / NCIMB 13405 / ORS 571) TaxID=438753 RepID=A8I272_AZOC5|nr:ParB/RepB/Spo0J family partition protein [Azorhizobium caulinodans]BAF90710.1 ParB-like partition protein [Azorhizobium caulinodans ORS 571]